MYKVLIVDDEVFIQRGLRICMDWAAYGCELIGAASSGEEALEMVRKNRPDIIISDIHMQNMSGLELIEQIGLQYPEIKTILFTGVYDFNNVYNAIKFDVVDLILKPTSPLRIQQALTKAIHQIETQNTTDTMRNVIKYQAEQNQRLKQVITISSLSSSSGNERAAKALSEVGLTLHHFLNITLLLNGYKLNPDEDASHLDEATRAITGYIDTIFDECEYYCSFSEQQSIHILLDFEQVSADTMRDVRAYCTDLSKTIDNLTELYSTIGISSIHTDPAELMKAKTESVNAANYAMYDKDTVSIAEYDHMPSLSTDTMNQLLPFLDRLSETIESRQEAGSLELLDQIFSYFADHKMPFAEIHSTGVLIADLCIRHLWNYKCNASSETTFSSKHVYYQNLLQSIHAAELKQNLRKIITLTVQNLSSAGGSTRSIVEQVEDYVRRNYREELSLEKIASHYHISSSYLGRLFKSKKNVSLSTYILHIRIEHAQELIQTTDMRTYEIAAAVGIPDPVYFSKTFKKVTGMRVRDFRSQHTAPSPAEAHA